MRAFYTGTCIPFEYSIIVPKNSWLTCEISCAKNLLKHLHSVTVSLLKNSNLMSVLFNYFHLYISICLWCPSSICENLGNQDRPTDLHGILEMMDDHLCLEYA